MVDGRKYGNWAKTESGGKKKKISQTQKFIFPHHAFPRARKAPHESARRRDDASHSSFFLGAFVMFRTPMLRLWRPWKITPSDPVAYSPVEKAPFHVEEKEDDGSHGRKEGEEVKKEKKEKKKKEKKKEEEEGEEEEDDVLWLESLKGMMPQWGKSPWEGAVGGEQVANLRVVVDALSDMRPDLPVWDSRGLMALLMALMLEREMEGGRSNRVHASPGTYAGEPAEVRDAAWARDVRHWMDVIQASYAKNDEDMAGLLGPGMEEGDVVKVVRRASPLRPGYLVGVDHERKAVFLAIRGTASLGDALTDLSAAQSEWPLSEGAHVHRGMLLSALWFVDHVGPLLVDAMDEHKGYELRIVGHSLGGAVGALTTLLLNAEGVDANALVIAPAACLSLDAAQDARSSVTSFVLGDDVIPRASVVSLEELRLEIVDHAWEDDVLESIKSHRLVVAANAQHDALQGQLAKAEAMGRDQLAKVSSTVSSSAPPELTASLRSKLKAVEEMGKENLARAEEGAEALGQKVGPMVTAFNSFSSSVHASIPSVNVPAIDFASVRARLDAAHSQVQSLLDVLDRDDEESSQKVADSLKLAELSQEEKDYIVPLYPPGAVHHIVRDEDGVNVHIVPKENKEFGEIVVSRQMLSDHACVLYRASMDVFLQGRGL